MEKTSQEAFVQEHFVEESVNYAISQYNKMFGKSWILFIASYYTALRVMRDASGLTKINKALGWVKVVGKAIVRSIPLSNHAKMDLIKFSRQTHSLEEWEAEFKRVLTYMTSEYMDISEEMAKEIEDLLED